jgi:chitinase
VYSIHLDATNFQACLFDKVAVGFLTGLYLADHRQPGHGLHHLGQTPAGTGYKLRKPTGYPGMMDAMFWTIDADSSGDYNYSNVVGPQLHSYAVTR